MIPIPKELIGTKIVPFMEWVYKNGKPATIEYYSLESKPAIKFSTEIYDFYNQPFTTEMLVGDNKIFEGWEKKNEYYYYEGLRISESLIFYLESNSGDCWEIKTLNDFISLCKMAGVELGEWK